MMALAKPGLNFARARTLKVFIITSNKHWPAQSFRFYRFSKVSRLTCESARAKLPIPMGPASNFLTNLMFRDAFKPAEMSR